MATIGSPRSPALEPAARSGVATSGGSLRLAPGIVGAMYCFDNEDRPFTEVWHATRSGRDAEKTRRAPHAASSVKSVLLHQLADPNATDDVKPIASHLTDQHEGQAHLDCDSLTVKSCVTYPYGPLIGSRLDTPLAPRDLSAAEVIG